MRRTTASRLHFDKLPAVLEGFCDANWVSDND